MKKLSAFILFILGLSVLSQPIIAQQHRKKVGIVLSGGGAKGMAHIKALKIIEEAGIPIDMIVGTSMGAIVGGLYAIGYTPMQLDSMVKAQNWNFLLSDRVKRTDMSLPERERSEKYIFSMPYMKKPKDMLSGGIIKGQNLSNLFANLTVGYHDSIDFNRLPIPFACVSTNVVNGEQVVFHNGQLATAMRASMAIPGVFTPIRMNNMILVDGGLINNFPVDVAKAMGADIVIGIDVKSKLRDADKLNGATDIIGQIIDLTCLNNYQNNVNLTDLCIKVNVDGYSSASFSTNAIDSLMERGEQAAREQWQSLLALKKTIGIPEDFEPTPHGPYNSLSISNSIFVKEITFSGLNDENTKWLIKKCRLEENKEITIRQIEQALNQLRANHSYSEASYNLSETENGYILNFLIEEKYEKRINLGLRFDSEEIASLLINGTAQLRTHIPSKLSLQARLGKRYAARVDYIIEPFKQRNLTFSYLFEHNDLNIYNKGDRAYNVIYNHHLGEFEFSDIWYKNLRFRIGARFEYFDYNDFLFKKEEYVINVKSEHFFSYYGQLEYNTFDKGYFPTKGSDVKAAYSIYTDNLAQYKGHAPFSALSASWSRVIPITSRFSMLPSVCGRVLIGDDLPYAFCNTLGGYYFGTHMPQEIPFAGIVNTEIVNRSLMIGSIKCRQRMGNVHYLTLQASYGMHSNSFWDLLTSKQFFGIAIGYGMDSMFGPLEFTLGYSNKTEKAVSFLNLGFYF